MRDRQKSIDHHRNYCVHYDPQGPGCGCKAQMDREKIQCVPTPSSNGKSMLKWGPCIAGHHLENPQEHCEKWEQRSLESAEKYANDIEACMNLMAIVSPIISEWRKKEPIGKRETLECPACKGRLHLNQSSYNGHIRAKCETEGCVNFIE